MKNKYKLVRNSILTGMLCLSLSGCSLVVECDINDPHFHIYQNSGKGLVRYLNGENKVYFSYVRCDEYVLATPILEIITEKKLFIANDNVDYLNNTINSYNNHREAYVYDLRYGTYYGWDYGYNNKGEYGYYYLQKTGYHYAYEWEEIGFDEYTEDKVRDIEYRFKFYKINEDGKIETKEFNSFEDREDGYDYFKESDLIQRYISDEYYLEKGKALLKE